MDQKLGSTERFGFHSANLSPVKLSLKYYLTNYFTRVSFGRPVPEPGVESAGSESDDCSLLVVGERVLRTPIKPDKGSASFVFEASFVFTECKPALWGSAKAADFVNARIGFEKLCKESASELDSKLLLGLGAGNAIP